MKKILVIISPQRESMDAIKWSIDRASQKKLAIEFFYIIDEKLTNDLEKCLSEKGFVGEKPGDELISALSQEYLKRGEEKIEELKKLASDQGIKSEGSVEKGNYLQEIYSKLNDQDLEMMVLTEHRKTIVERIFSRSEAKQVMSKTNLKVKVFEIG